MLTLLLLSYLGLLPGFLQEMVDDFRPTARRWAWLILLLWALAVVGRWSGLAERWLL